LSTATGKAVQEYRADQALRGGHQFHRIIPSATPRMSSQACSVLAMQHGAEPVMQIAARDRTRMGLQSEVMGAAA